MSDPREPIDPGDAVDPDAVESEVTAPDVVEPDAAANPDAAEPDVVEPSAAEPDAIPPTPPGTPRVPRRPGRFRRAALLGLRVVAGTVASGAAVATVLAVGLVPLPTVGVEPLSVTVTPQPADQLRVCAGSLLRFGDSSGTGADTPQRVGAPELDVAPTDGSVALSRVEGGDAGGGSGAPTVLRLPAEASVAPAGVQTQRSEQPGLTGLAMTGCVEPSSSAWLVGGATTTGRTTLVLLSNPGDVDADVSVDIWGEGGAVAAAGARGILVPAGTQRALSLAGFAPDLTAPVIRVTSTGGSVAAALQTSVVRGITDGGVEMIGPSAAPGLALAVPGVRIVGAAAVANALAREGWDDAAAVVRVGVPGPDPAKVRVTVVPADPDGEASFFELDIDAGSTAEAPLDSGVATESGLALPDGAYTVLVESDRPVVAGVRATAAVEPPPGAEDEFGGPAAPASDLAWFPAATPLTGAAIVPAGSGPDAALALANPAEEPMSVTVRRSGTSADTVVELPGRGGAVVELEAGEVVELSGAEGVAVGISAAAVDGGSALLAAFALAPPRPLSAPVVVHP